MDLVKAPLRISYVGGGTDFPEFYKNSPGAGVIAAAIDKHVYLYAHELSEFAEENLRFTYRETESVLEIGELNHPVMREMLKQVEWNERTNFGTFADLPSGMGLGGSSSFAVALANLIFVKRKLIPDPHKLAELAVLIERVILREAGGVQDQYIAAFGGLRNYQFSENEVIVSDDLLNSEATLYLEERQMLISLGESRLSKNHAQVTRTAILNSSALLHKTVELLQVTTKAIQEAQKPEEYFAALRDGVRFGWELKRGFTSDLSDSFLRIEKLLGNYKEIALKLCGAGGTGVVLILGEPEILKEISLLAPDNKILFPKIAKQGSVHVANI